MKLRRQLSLMNGASIREKINNAAKTATSYITTITGTSGISVHDANDTSNYVNITSGLINLVTGGTSRLKAYVENNVAKLRVGDASSGHIMIEPNSIDMITGGISRLKTYIEDNIAKLRIGNAAAGHIVIDPDSIDFKDGNDELASFDANGTQLGKNNPYAEIAFNDRHGILYGKDYAGLQYGLELGIEDRDPDNKWADDYNNLMTRMFVEKIPDNTKEYHAFLDLEAFDDSSHYTLTCNGNRYDSEGEELPSVSPKNIGRLEINSTRGYAFVGNMAMAGGTVEDYGVGVITTLSNDGTYSTTDIDITGNRILFNGNVIHSSDKRLKEHIEEVDDKAVKFIRSLKPVHFKLRGEEMTGFYAQDVEEIDPWGCFVSENENGYKALNYTGLIAPLVAYCQRLEERIRKFEEQ